MNITDHLLVCLAEECAELAQRTSKAIRFGLTEVQMGQPKSNAHRLVDEFNDVVAVAELLEESGNLRGLVSRGAIEAKKEKLRAWMEYSRTQGTLESPSCPLCASVPPPSSP